MGDAPASGDGIQAASDRIRETAKWLTVSFGAIGALLLAGTQLSSIGQLSAGSERLTVAVTGGVLAGLGTIAVLVASVLVATTPVMSLSRLAHAKPPVGTEAARTDRFLLMGYESVGTLQSAYQTAITERRTAIEQYTGTQTDADRAAQARAQTIDGIVTRLVQVAAHTNLSRRWRNAVWPICIGAVVAAVGVILFVWAANPPEDAAGSTLTPGVLDDAKAGVLTLTSLGQEALAEALDCEVDEPLEVLVLERDDAGAEVIVIARGCEAVRALVTPAWGAVTLD
ncbi:hypothetical protein [Microbacterium hominis]|uniref:Uncharacterized protein n=1 Tax=Microbacterium hominis TaxID=162426 RepID=A0A7D4PV66_9MICO|nr:hypothetical protein [Microbacterium hominis]QKJ20273.1 hypothetical protein HQM25_13505 [Microbacterium hominis]